MYNLWACFSHNLDITAAADGLENEDLTKDQILIKVKRLAVKSRNTLVSQVQFFQTGQDRGKLAINYLSRLRSASASCNFTVKCNENTIYADPLSPGGQRLLDSNIQEKILSKAVVKIELTLQDITNAVEALEMAKRDQATFIGRHGDLNR